MNDQESTSSAPSRGTALLLRPVESAASAVRRVPGVGAVGGMVDGVLDTVGLVSPRARRIAAYTGAGLLGAVGAVEWPVAAAGAAAVWLTQARSKSSSGSAATPARDGAPAAKSRTTEAPKAFRSGGTAPSRRRTTIAASAGSSRRKTV
ncbi:hypothetical protein [Kitasatospora aureofaciens]|uniref:hypothetical protein n=1 Tax=Kitasatospora aureofaciens TaxID=1894 RepID=UPI00068F0BA5|nr:hypothetical protein [Kitasatospora aureofaciens]